MNVVGTALHRLSPPAEKTEGSSPALQLFFPLHRAPPAIGGERPNDEEESALATQKFRGADRNVSPALCEAINRVVSLIRHLLDIFFLQRTSNSQSVLRNCQKRLNTHVFVVCSRFGLHTLPALSDPALFATDQVM